MNSQLFSQEEINDILDKDVLELIGGKDLPQEKKEELYLKMAQTIENRVIARIDDKLNDAEREEWLQTIDTDDKAKMEEFLRSKDIDVAKLMVEESLIYKTEIASCTKNQRSEDVRNCSRS